MSRSTPEAETVAMDTAVGVMTIPLLSQAEDILGVKSVHVCGGNQAMLHAIIAGRNPAMRHVSIAHR